MTVVVEKVATPAEAIALAPAVMEPGPVAGVREMVSPEPVPEVTRLPKESST